MGNDKFPTWPQVMQNNYGEPALNFVRGSGSWLFTDTGDAYLDGLGGIATNILGQCHPKVVKAAQEAMANLSHISNLYSHPAGLALAAKLQSMLGDEAGSTVRVFFCNSGAEANEAAIKSARLTGRKRLVAAVGGFHGRTIGALSITGQRPKQEPFLPLMEDIQFIPYGDIPALEQAIDSNTAMLILEPIQGENGVVVPPTGYLKAAREITRKHGALFAIDEVQTGMGRTGKWFAFQHELTPAEYPDLITMAKALGGGLPMGALIALANAPKFAPGQHGSTFGGNPIVAAASLATIQVIEDEELLARAVSIQHTIAAAFESLPQLPAVCCVRGQGALMAVVFDKRIAKEVAQKAANLGLLVNAATPSVIRLAPALNIAEPDLQKLIEILKNAISQVITELSQGESVQS